MLYQYFWNVVYNNKNDVNIPGMKEEEEEEEEENWWLATKSPEEGSGCCMLRRSFLEWER